MSHPILVIQPAGDPPLTVRRTASALFCETPRDVQLTVVGTDKVLREGAAWLLERSKHADDGHALWRCRIPVNADGSDAGSPWILVSVDPPATPRPWRERTANGGRAHVSVADTGAPQPTADAEITMARCLLAELPTEPVTSLEQCAAIAAELAEGTTPRHDVLAGHEMDEHDWLVEERTWLERMATAAGEGDATLAVRYGQAFNTASMALVTVEQLDADAARHARIAAALEEAPDPTPVLDAEGMSVAQWVRLDRYVMR